MATRPAVNVYKIKEIADEGRKPKLSSEVCGSTRMASVFSTPLRPDILSFVHDQMRKNTRQPYAVSARAGHGTSAESWGTGRAVARIPRVRGGGTSRSGQGAFGNMCRGGHMFAPTKVWRRWHRKINVKQRQQAMLTAIAATGVPNLVMARGHKIETTPEFPLVISDDYQSISKTKDAVKVLRATRAWRDIVAVQKSKRSRPGKGTMRNRKYVMKRGPIVIYDQDNGITRAFRNIPGITLLNVNRLNVLKLAPGGHMGRLAIWTESAFRGLDKIYGPSGRVSIPKPTLTQDPWALVQEIRESLRPSQLKYQKKAIVKKNPLKNNAILKRLNPHAVGNKKAERALKRKATPSQDAPAAKKVVKKATPASKKAKK